MKLPNNCSVSEIKVCKSASAWFIHYTFYCPEFPNGKRIQHRPPRLNKITDLKKRESFAKGIIKEYQKTLLSGYNPVLKAIRKKASLEVEPETPFIDALRVAFTKLKVTPGTQKDIKSVIDGVEIACKKLLINKMPVKEVTIRYFKQIFEKCAEINPKFSANRQNKYRAYLMKLYKELIQMEAVQYNPLRDIPKEREIRKLRRLPTLEERKLINDHLKKYHIQFWKCVMIFYHSGCRENELMNVKVKDVDIKNQRVKYLVKKGNMREIYRPIKDSIVWLWEELIKDAPPEYYVFSKGLVPGPVAINSKQVNRRWANYVKGKVYHKGAPKTKNDPTKLYLDVDMYPLKHLNTTEVMDELNDIEEVRKLTGHTSGAMITKIYDINFSKRKDDKIKSVKNQF